ncbi:unnamed protein product, partial [Nesidiocoris tenuis]
MRKCLSNDDTLSVEISTPSWISREYRKVQILFSGPSLRPGAHLRQNDAGRRVIFNRITRNTQRSIVRCTRDADTYLQLASLRIGIEVDAGTCGTRVGADSYPAARYPYQYSRGNRPVHTRCPFERRRELKLVHFGGRPPSYQQLRIFAMSRTVQHRRPIVLTCSIQICTRSPIGSSCIGPKFEYWTTHPMAFARLSGRSWEAEFRFFSDAKCSTPTLVAAAHGHYSTAKTPPDRVLGASDFDFVVDKGFLTLHDKGLVASLQKDKRCGPPGEWQIGVKRDLTPSKGCPPLGIVIPTTEYELVRVEVDTLGNTLLYLGHSDRDSTKKGEPKKRPTAFQPPLLQCNAPELPPLTHFLNSYNSATQMDTWRRFLLVLTAAFLPPRERETMTRTKTAQKKKIDVCPNCKENITNGDKAVLCDGKCRSWFHINCVGISEKRYQALLDDDTWLCRNCGPTPPAPLDSSEFSKFVIDDQNPAFKRIGDTLNQITCSLSELQRSVQYQSSQYDEFYRDMKSMQLENARLNKDMTSVKEDVKRLDMDGDWLKKRVNHLEQTMIANELEINGIPGNFTGNVFDILNKICDLIKIKIEEQDVIDIRRINSDRRQRGNSPTIVVFRDRSIRQKILDSRKSIPTLTLKDVGVDSP